MKTDTLQKNIPQGWSLKKLSDVLDYERPDEYIVKSTSYNDKLKTPVLTANKSFVLGYTDEDFGIYKNVPAIIFDDFTTDSKFVDFPFKIKSSAIKILKEKNEDVDLRFVFEKMKSVNFPTGSHKRFYISQYQNLEIAVPPIKEQQKIAEILGVVDEDIAKTQEVIEGTEKLKRGLMQQLFTRGIGHTKFKETKIGEIPDGWRVGTLDEITEKISVGFVGTCEPFYTDESGVPMLRTGNLKEWGIDISDLKYVTKEFHIKNKKSQINSGDILIARHGENGLACLVPEGFPESNCLNVVIIRPNSETLDSKYLFYAINSPLARGQIEAKTGGSTQKVVNTSDIKLVLIGLPEKPEQQKIAEILSAVDEKISVNKKLKEKLILLKKGLMQDLLSGRVRVLK